MGRFEHHRFEIWNQVQHPYRHDLNDFAYTSGALPGVSTIESALNWIVGVLYPIPKASVANVAALPSVGNTISDYRVVVDDGDGKSAGYRWEQREGDATAKWYKIYDMDFGAGSVLQQAMDNAQELFVQKFGNNDRDSTGAVVTDAINKGQHIYGGTTTLYNLTFHANSGDGVGATTGYIQFADQVRPTVDNAFDLGTSALTFRSLYFSTQTLANAGSVSVPPYSFAAETTLGLVRTGTAAAKFVGTTASSLSFTIENQNTNGNSLLQILTQAGSGDAFILFNESGGSAWTIGRDDSDSGAWKISQSTTLGTNDFFKVATTGALTMGVTGVNHAVAGKQFVINDASTTGVLFQLSNTNNTAVNSYALAYLSVGGGTSTGDPYINFNIVSVRDWCIGIDNSDSDQFKISGSAALGTSDYFAISTGGALTLGASNNALTHTWNGKTFQYTGPSGGNNSVQFILQNQSTTAAITQLYLYGTATGTGDQSYVASKQGDGSADWGWGRKGSDGSFRISAGGNLGTTDALIFDYTTLKATFAGYVQIGNQADPGAVTDGVRLGSQDVSAGNATLSLRTETALVSEVVVSDRTLSIYHNGTLVKLCVKS